MCFTKEKLHKCIQINFKNPPSKNLIQWINQTYGSDFFIKNLGDFLGRIEGNKTREKETRERMIKRERL